MSRIRNVMTAKSALVIGATWLAAIASLTHAAVLRNTQLQQQDSQKRNLDETPQEATGGVIRKIPKEEEEVVLAQCDPFPMLHARFTDQKLKKEYRGNLDYAYTGYKANLAPGTISKELRPEEFTVLPEADFILWGPRANGGYGGVELSAYNKDTLVHDIEGWYFISPDDRNKSAIGPESIMELQGDHAIFVIYHHSVFAHLLLDYLPYISYIKDKVPSSTRIILADANNRSKASVEKLDPEFAKRVDWIECTHHHCEDNAQLVKVRNGSLTVFHPPTLHHMDYLLSARRWLLEKNPPKPKSLEQRTVLYYTRNGAHTSGRKMDIKQEEEMLKLIKHNLVKYNRPEKLVIFDGTLDLLEAVDMWQSANFVIGAHGGGLANLLFLLPSESCQERPKVLEFLNNSQTLEVQSGGMNRNYYFCYSTTPWVEYHHILYVPPSTYEGTYVNMFEFRDAIKDMFKPNDAPQTLQ